MAGREGFEPPEGLHLRRFSRPEQSTALPPTRRQPFSRAASVCPVRGALAVYLCAEMRVRCDCAALGRCRGAFRKAGVSLRGSWFSLATSNPSRRAALGLDPRATLRPHDASRLPDRPSGRARGKPGGCGKKRVNDEQWRRLPGPNLRSQDGPRPSRGDSRRGLARERRFNLAVAQARRVGTDFSSTPPHHRHRALAA